ncbi:hypothetical protein ACFL2K_00500 [Candidatus Margulisiibacteriota bacterium]
MSEKNITFGTSGHRGIIGEAFSAEHVTAIAWSIAEYLAKFDNPKIALGFDPRPGNSPNLEEGSFTKIICDVLISQGINVHVFSHFAATPLVSWYIRNYKMEGGLILTASHNPGIYNGIKFNPANGAPAPNNVTKAIEDIANEHFGKGVPKAKSKIGTVTKINMDNAFARALIKNIRNKSNLNSVDLSEVPVVVDAKHGTAASLWKAIFHELKINKFAIINAEALPDFGGIEPNPTKLYTLGELKTRQKTFSAPIAIANDPDADRHVILNEKGDPVSPELISVIILDYLVSQNANLKGIASTVASSAIVKNAVEKNNLEYIETAVGFKYFGEFLETADKEGKIGLAVESSGGFTASYHVFEKCGFMPCIFILMILKATGKKLSELVMEMQEKYGVFYFLEEEYKFAPEKKRELINLFKSIQKEDIQKESEDEIINLNKTDGVKINFADGWVLMRLSGTEPIARIYAESEIEEKAKKYLELAKNILK